MSTFSIARRASLTALTIVLVGCFPVYVYYYHPSAPTGQIVRSPGRADTPDSWAIPTLNGRLLFKATSDDADKTRQLGSFWNDLFTSRTSTDILFLEIRFSEAAATVARSNWMKHVIETACGISTPIAAVSVAVAAPVMAPPYVNHLATGDVALDLTKRGFVILGYESCHDAAEAFRFHPQPLWLDGKAVQLPRISFKASRRVGLALINGT